jgi:hypothetical protein
MFKKVLFLLSFFLFSFTIISFANETDLNQNDILFKPGEQITYLISWNGIGIGDMKLTFWGDDNFEGKDVYKITSETNSTQYDGMETIYVDKERFIPLVVFRELKYMGKQEKIEERYDQENNILTITKQKSDNVEKQVIEKDTNIQNSILLYYLTRLKKVKVGENFDVVLPTRDYNIKVKDIQNIKDANGKKVESYLFTSTPKKFKIWVGKDKNIFPIKMTCSSFLSVVSMHFKDIKYIDLALE